MTGPSAATLSTLAILAIAGSARLMPNPLVSLIRYDLALLLRRATTMLAPQQAHRHRIRFECCSDFREGQIHGALWRTKRS